MHNKEDLIETGHNLPKDSMTGRLRFSAVARI